MFEFDVFEFWMMWLAVLGIVLAVISIFFVFLKQSNKIGDLEEEIESLKLSKTISESEESETRRVEDVFGMIHRASKKLQVFDINALCQLHEAREELINLLNKGGKVQILLLDPESMFFKNREEKEEKINKKMSGRLLAEWKASRSIIRDICNFTTRPKNLESRVLAYEPIFSLMIRDEEEMLVNICPKRVHSRCLEGVTYRLKRDRHSTKEEFEKRLDTFEKAWKKARPIDLLT